MQLRFATGLTSEDYVSREAWREASLPRCPLHPRGGCGFARHGTYERVRPRGTRVARWYCKAGHRTFSLLPDCLAARLPGTLAEVEAVVVAVEQARSQEAAADRLRPEVLLPGALRWIRRRVQRVRAALAILRGAFPEHFLACPATVSAFRSQLGVTPVLPALRAIPDAPLGELPAPLGFRPRLGAGGEHVRRLQHKTGTDPPRSPR